MKSLFDLSLPELEQLEEAIGKPVGVLFGDGPRPAAYLVAEQWLLMKDQDPDLTPVRFRQAIEGKPLKELFSAADGAAADTEAESDPAGDEEEQDAS